MLCLCPLAKHLFAPLPKLGQPEMTSINLENLPTHRINFFNIITMQTYRPLLCRVTLYMFCLAYPKVLHPAVHVIIRASPNDALLKHDYTLTRSF